MRRGVVTPPYGNVAETFTVFIGTHGNEIPSVGVVIGF